MLLEKNTLLGLLVLWFTGCRAVSPGHLPFCSRASISVPGAPASSLLTGNQVLVLNPGVEICAPVCVATALLCTCQPDEPRFEMSVAPGLAGELASAAARTGDRAAADVAAGDAAWAGASAPSVGSSTAEKRITKRRKELWRALNVMAADSCPIDPR